MNRRRLISGLVGAATVALAARLPLMASSNDRRFQRQKELNTFNEDDTMLVRLDKLNALMSTDYHLVLHQPKEWANQPETYTTKELLEATSPRLDSNHDFQWGVYLTRNGKQWTGMMSPVDYFHWTAQVGLGYRLAKAQ